MKLLALLASALVLLAPAQATIIYGTGLGGPGQRDANWSVVAVPTSWSGAPSTPYQPYIFQTGAVNWYGPSSPWDNPQKGYTNADGHFYWIGLQADSGSVLPFPTAWNWIVAQTFTVEQAGDYSLTFPAFSDELLDVYVNGTVTTDALLPTIAGGTRITSGATNHVNFQTMTMVTGQSYLNAGENTIYAQVRDSGFSTGLMLGNIAINTAAPVPEPGTWAAAALLLGGAGFLRWRKGA